MNKAAPFTHPYLQLVTEYKRLSAISKEQYPITMDSFRALQEARDAYRAATTMEERVILQTKVEVAQQEYQHQADLLSEKEVLATETNRKAREELERIMPQFGGLNRLRDKDNTECNGTECNGTEHTDTK